MRVSEIAAHGGRIAGRSRLLLNLPLVLVALGLATAPGAARLWQYHRDAVLTGHWWRLAICHIEAIRSTTRVISAVPGESTRPREFPAC